MTTAIGNDGGNSGMSWRLIGWAIPVLLLSLPLILGAPWSLGDYIFAGTAFAIVGATFELVVRSSRNKWHRAGSAMALLTSLLLLWVNGAVGIIGNEDNPANLMFVVVILMALAGSIAAKFESAGMARAMTVAAIAQAMIAVGALAYGLGSMEPPGLLGVVIIILGFGGMWLIAAGLFAQAARTR